VRVKPPNFEVTCFDFTLFFRNRSCKHLIAAGFSSVCVVQDSFGSIQRRLLEK